MLGKGAFHKSINLNVSSIKYSCKSDNVDLFTLDLVFQESVVIDGSDDLIGSDKQRAGRVFPLCQFRPMFLIHAHI